MVENELAVTRGSLSQTQATTQTSVQIFFLVWNQHNRIVGDSRVKWQFSTLSSRSHRLFCQPIRNWGIKLTSVSFKRSHTHYYNLSHTILFSLTHTTIFSCINNYTLSHTTILSHKHYYILLHKQLYSLTYTTILSHIHCYTLSHTLLYSLTYTTIHSHTYM